MTSKIQNINDRIQKYKSISSSTSNNIVTAWQLSSSISNMEQFIKYIETDNRKKQQLKKILPYAERIKRVNEEKQYIGREIKALLQETEKGYNMAESLVNRHDEKSSKNSNKLNNTPNIISKFEQKPNTNKSQIKLKIACQNIIKITEQQDKRINQIKKLIDLKKEKYFEQIQKQQGQLLKQIQEEICKRKQQLKKQIKQQKTLFNKQTIFQEQISKFVKQKIQYQINSDDAQNFEEQQQKSHHQNKNKPNNQFLKSSTKHFLNKQYTQLGQINCKLLSLQDKKRKLTIKHELNKTINQYELSKGKKQNQQNIMTNNKNQSKQSQKKSKQIKGPTAQKSNQHHHHKGLLSVVSRNKNKEKPPLQQTTPLIKSPQNKSQTIYNNQTYQKHQQTKDQKHQNQQINNQILLSIIQIKTQILELKQHLTIGFNQNIMNNIISSVKKVQKINEELKQIIEEAINMKVIFSQSFGNMEEGRQREKSHESVQDSSRFINQVLQQATNPNSHYPNTYLSFFINIIEQKLSERQKLIRNLIISYNYSLKTLKKYYQQKYHRQILTQVKQLQAILIQSNYITKSDQKNLIQQSQGNLLSSNKKILKKNTFNNLIQKQYHSLLNLFNTFQSQIKFICLLKMISVIDLFDKQIVGLVQRNEIFRKILDLQQSNISKQLNCNNVIASYDQLVKSTLQENLKFENQIISIIFKSNKKDLTYSDYLNDKNFVSLFLDWYQQFTKQLQTIWLDNPQTN